jgi:hypothetical protein
MQASLSQERKKEKTVYEMIRSAAVFSQRKGSMPVKRINSSRIQKKKQGGRGK